MLMSQTYVNHHSSIPPNSFLLSSLEMWSYWKLFIKCKCESTKSVMVTFYDKSSKANQFYTLRS